MGPDCVEHVPPAKKNLAVWIHCLQGSYLRLIMIGHYYAGPDRRTCISDTSDKERNYFCHRT